MSEVGKFSVIDPRIVQQKPTYAVEKGALSLTNVPQQAISATSSQQGYNIQVPSENVFVDRAVDWESEVCLVVTGAAAGGTAPVSGAVLSPGVDSALAAFPLHQLVSTMSATINDTTVTVNTSDVLPQVLRLVDMKKTRMQRTCATMLDKFQASVSPADISSSQLAGYSQAYDSCCVPNGSWGWAFLATDGGNVIPNGGTFVTGGVTYTVTGADGQGYGGYLQFTSGSASGVPQWFLKFRSVEKLVLPPFIFGDQYELTTGLFGVQNMQLTMNIAGGQSRCLRVVAGSSLATALGATGEIKLSATSPWGSGRPRIQVQFLTPSLDVPLPPKSIVPYMEFPRFISTPTITSTWSAQSVSSSLQSQTITLPNIPDFLYIYAKPATYAGPTVSDFVFPCTSISVNFDNFSGLLSSHTQEELYKMSVNNGLEQDWLSWSGRAVAAGATTLGFANTVGGGLLLRPSRDIVLQAGQAPSLVGNFTFQFNATFFNNTSATVSSVNLYVIAISSGFFETIKGSSRIIKGVLTEQDILSAPSVAETVTDSSLRRLVGGAEQKTERKTSSSAMAGGRATGMSGSYSGRHQRGGMGAYC